MSEVLDLLNKIVGKPVWGARRSYGSAFFIEIGSPHLEIREAYTSPGIKSRSPALARRKITPVGEYSILVLYCNWIISYDNIICTNESDVELIEKAMDAVSGNYVVSVDDERLPIPKTTLHFDSGLTLSVMPNDEFGEGDQWCISVPGVGVCALYLDGSVIR